jgi:hypothetical protein
MTPGVPQGRRGMQRGVAGHASAVRANIMHAWEALARGKCLPSAAGMGCVLCSHPTFTKMGHEPKISDKRHDSAVSPHAQWLQPRAAV